MTAFEVPSGFELPDVLLPGRPDTRPIRRAIDLFRLHASEAEWDRLCQYTVKALSESLSQRDDRKILSIQVMLLGDWNNIRSTEDARRVQEGRYKTWALWMQTEAPDWYKELLRLNLEMWSLQIPEGADQNNLRKTYQTFAIDCGSLTWGWDNHNDAEKRINLLQKCISQIETPRRSWTSSEKEIFDANYEVSFLPYLQELPPAVEGQLRPADSYTRRPPRHPLEEAAYAYLDSVFPGIENADVSAWPIEPCWVMLRADKKLHRILMVFRYNNAISRIPRLSEAFGLMEVMGAVNEMECDSSHPLFAGELKYGTLRRVVLFDMKGAPTTLVRTWVNRGKPTKSDLTKGFFLADGGGMRRVKLDVYTKAKSLKSKK